eukprot:3116477-Rhodomonas_salina.1
MRSLKSASTTATGTSSPRLPALTPRNQVQEAALLVHIGPSLRFLGVDFAVRYAVRAHSRKSSIHAKINDKNPPFQYNSYHGCGFLYLTSHCIQEGMDKDLGQALMCSNP